jgi:hypothetical protein
LQKFLATGISFGGKTLLQEALLIAFLYENNSVGRASSPAIQLD